jgi:hypothetical protein
MLDQSRRVAPRQHTDPTRSDLETHPMSRPTGHPAVKPFRLTRSAVEAHRAHLPTPFLGCPVCARRPRLDAPRIRWSSPRLG